MPDEKDKEIDKQTKFLLFFFLPLSLIFYGVFYLSILPMLVLAIFHFFSNDIAKTAALIVFVAELTFIFIWLLKEFFKGKCKKKKRYFFFLVFIAFIGLLSFGFLSSGKIKEDKYTSTSIKTNYHTRRNKNTSQKNIRPQNKKRTNPESFYRNKAIKYFKDGKIEVLVPNNTRCDIATKKYAIEVDFANKWQEAVGQSLNYANQLQKDAGILLIVEEKEDFQFAGKLIQLIRVKT